MKQSHRAPCSGEVRFALAAFAFEVAVILIVAITVGTGYHLTAYGEAGLFNTYIAIGGIAALAYTLPFVFREEYSVQAYLDGHRDFERTFIVWNAAFLSLAVVGFLTKSTEIASRGMLVLFYAGGLSALTATACGHTRCVAIAHCGAEACRAPRHAGWTGRRDPARSIGIWRAPDRHSHSGNPDSARRTLPMYPATPWSLRASFDTAVDKARLIGVDDVILLVEWSRTELIQDIINAYSQMPVAIHLGASSLLGAFLKSTGVASRRADRVVPDRAAPRTVSGCHEASIRFHGSDDGPCAVVASICRHSSCNKGNQFRAGVLPTAAERVQLARVPHLEVSHDDDARRRSADRTGQCK